MTTLHATNVFNVQASLNAWLQAALAAIDRPYWLPSYQLVLIAPEEEMPTPSFSVNHIDVGTFDRYQGRAAQHSMGIMEVNAWVSRSNFNWQAQLATMQAMVKQAALAQASGGVVINDYSDVYTPVASAYRALLSDVQSVATAPDPNPDIQRVRLLINYRWTLRAS